MVEIASASEYRSPLAPGLRGAAPAQRHFAQASFEVPGPVERVFPLFDPINEARWAEGWAITPILPSPFRVERNAVFLTDAGDRSAVWTILRFEPDAHRVEYLVVVPDHHQRWITVGCTPRGEATQVTVSYTVTPLSRSGEDAALRYSEAFIESWQEPVTRALREAADEPQG